MRGGKTINDLFSGQQQQAREAGSAHAARIVSEIHEETFPKTLTIAKRKAVSARGQPRRSSTASLPDPNPTMPRVAGTMKDISEFSAKEKHRRAKIPQGFKAPTRSSKVSAFTAYVLAVSAELNGIEKVSAAKEEAQAAKAVAAAREAAVEARLEKDGRTVIKCMVAEGEEPSTFWAGVQTQDNDKGDKRCLCSTCSRAQRDELIAQADVAPQDEPVPSSSALPSP